MILTIRQVLEFTYIYVRSGAVNGGGVGGLNIFGVTKKT